MLLVARQTKNQSAIRLAGLGAVLLAAVVLVGGAFVKRQLKLPQMGQWASVRRPLEAGTVATCSSATGWRKYKPKTSFHAGDYVCVYAEALNVNRGGRIDVTFSVLVVDSGGHEVIQGRGESRANTRDSSCADWGRLLIPYGTKPGTYIARVEMMNKLDGGLGRASTPFEVVAPDIKLPTTTRNRNLNLDQQLPSSEQRPAPTIPDPSVTAANMHNYISVKPPLVPANINGFMENQGLRVFTTISKECVSNPNNAFSPFVTTGDFDGDGLRDYALDVKTARGFEIVVILGNGHIHELRAWQYIYTDKRRGMIHTWNGDVNLQYDSIGGVRCESSSVIYVYNKIKDSFEKYFTSD